MYFNFVPAFLILHLLQSTKHHHHTQPHPNWLIFICLLKFMKKEINK